jgi:hypothetical protein
MSQTFSIACRDCKVHLWIAQGRSPVDGHVYTGSGAAIYAFLQKHRKHELVFDENCETDIADYEEIEL